MEKIIEIYHSLFPHTTGADWFYCLMGLVLHAYLKVKHLYWTTFKWKKFVTDFLPVWIYAVVCIVLCMGTLPQYLSNYGLLDSALIGYSSGSFFRNVLKQRAEQINVPLDEDKFNHPNKN